MKIYSKEIKIIGSLLILVLVIITAGVVSYSKDNASVPEYKHITKLEVKYGDTLWGIAEQYITDEYKSVKDYVKEIKLTNNLKDNKIYPTQSLVIPYYDKVD